MCVFWEIGHNIVEELRYRPDNAPVFLGNGHLFIPAHIALYYILAMYHSIKSHASLAIDLFS